MDALWTKITEVRGRDERRSSAPDPAMELLLISKMSEESNEAGELYRRLHGWGTDGHITATLPEVQDEVCAAILAGMVALDRISPSGTAGEHWNRYLTYGYERALAENTRVQT